MWRTPCGERTLSGAEAALFREALAMAVDHALMNFDDPEPFGFPAFDRLAGKARLTLLAQVGAALLREDAPTPELTSLSELTVGVIFDEILTGVAVEIDSEPDGVEDADARPTWRQRVLASARECEVWTADELPAADCDDAEEWDLLVEALRDQILWDEDWLADDEFLDADPAVARSEKRRLGIADDYYRAVPPDPTEAEFERVLATLRELTGSPVPHPDDLGSLTGIEDLYHGLFAGPCDGATADREAEHPLVLSLRIFDPDPFDVSYGQWADLAKPALAGVIEILPPDAPLPPVSVDEVRLALAGGLPDGTRFERRARGWVVVDGDGFCLADSPDPLWTQTDDEEDDPPAYFESPEAAWLGLKRSEAARQAIDARREKVLEQLDADDGNDSSHSEDGA